MKTVVDTSALLALLYPNDEHSKRASELLNEARSQGAVVINPITYAELSADSTFDRHESVDAFFEDTGIRVEEAERETYFVAGKRFQEYLDNRGEKLQCPGCGEETVFDCPNCGEMITARQHLPADFVIGAHTEEQADALLTFDTGFFNSYFETELRGIR